MDYSRFLPSTLKLKCHENLETSKKKKNDIVVIII